MIFRFHGNKIVTRTATKKTSTHDHDRTAEEDPKERKTRSHLAMQAQLQKYEGDIAETHDKDDVNGVWET